MNRRLAYPLAISIFVLFVILLGLSSFKLDDTRIIEADGSESEVSLPFLELSGASAEFTIAGTAKSSVLRQGVIRIVPDDMIKEIKVNGYSLSLARIPAKKKSDYLNGFIYNLGAHLTNQVNQVEFVLNNLGGPRALTFKPTFNDFRVTFFVTGIGLSFLFLIFLLITQPGWGLLAGDWRAGLVFTGLLFLGLVLRFLLVPLGSGDLGVFKSWLSQINAGGGFVSLGKPFYDYTPFFPYLMASLAPLNLPPEFTIKLPAIIFDLITAFVLMALAFRLSAKRSLALTVFFAFFFLPSVVFNSSWWGQCDVIYSGFALLSLSFLLKDQSTRRDSFWAMVFLSLGFAFKQQVVFLAPLYAILLFKRRIVWWQVALVPLVYLVMTLPALIAGRPLGDLLTIYLGQIKMFGNLTLGLPNLYQWLPAVDTLSAWGIVLALAFTLGLLWKVLATKKDLDAKTILSLALLSALVFPFILPHMHERYYFTADLLAVLYGFVIPGRWFVPVAVAGTSFISYLPFLFEKPLPLDASILSLVILAVIVVLVKDLSRGYFSAKPVRDHPARARFSLRRGRF